MWRSSRIYFRSTLVSTLHKLLAPSCFQQFISLLYADDTCIVFQHKSKIDIEKQLIKDFSSVCDWFVENKLSIHFGQDKTKSILILYIKAEKLNNMQKSNIWDVF